MLLCLVFLHGLWHFHNNSGETFRLLAKHKEYSILKEELKASHAISKVQGRPAVSTICRGIENSIVSIWEGSRWHKVKTGYFDIERHLVDKRMNQGIACGAWMKGKESYTATFLERGLLIYRVKLLAEDRRDRKIHFGWTFQGPGREKGK